MGFRRLARASEAVAVVGIAVILLSGILGAQECAECMGASLGVVPGNAFAPAGRLDVPNAAPFVFHKRVDEVTLFFTVTRGRKYVDDLNQEEIHVSDDHKEPERISAFGRQRDLPLRMALLIDTSNSIHFRFAFEQDAATRFLQQIVRRNMDRAFVMGFSDQARLTQDYTDDPQKLARGVYALSSDGGTALFDAIRLACDKLGKDRSQVPMANVLVLLTDGEDNSSKVSLARAIETAQRREVTIYTISTSNGRESMSAGERVLKQLAGETGGQMFQPNRPKDLVKAFAAIDQEMRSRYALSYKPRELQEDGRFRAIELIAQRARKKFRVHARKGYYAPMPQ